jgi:hypothetical protein
MAPSASALARMNELGNGSCLISSVLVPHSHHPIIQTKLFEGFGVPTVPKLAFEEFFLPFSGILVHLPSKKRETPISPHSTVFSR